MPAIDQLLDVMQKLRDPETGCAWDIEQSFETIAPYTIEEAYEVADAIARQNTDDIKDELGDLLLQVVFHAQMASEQKLFDFDDIANAITDKLVRRHPHVFDKRSDATPDELYTAWEAQKALERNASTAEDQSALAGIALALPSLKRADKIQRRAARVGFDWPEIAPVWDKLNEEISEVHEAVANKDNNAIEDEIGDLLFTVVNLARHHRVDSEVALHKANAKFDKRFRQVEDLASQRGEELPALDLAALDALWNEAKSTDY